MVPTSAATALVSAEDTLLSQKLVARILSVSPRALEAWRMRGGGPPFIRISKRCVRYRRCDVEAWLADLKQRSSQKGH